MNIYYLTGLSMLIVGCYIRYEIRRRRFYRRGPGGLQNFKNYRSATLITMMENLLSLITIFLVIGGICIIAWGYRENHINDKPNFEIRSNK